MKTYRTWLAVKMLTENRKLKFKNNNDEILKRVYDVPQVNAYSGNKELLLYLTTNWELVQEPVTFMEAINSGKRIKPVNWKTYQTLRVILDNLKCREYSDQVETINGKWFIEDGGTDE